jgi:hypothetical protein
VSGLCDCAVALEAAATADGSVACSVSAEDIQALLTAALSSSAVLPTAAVAHLFELAAAKALGPNAVEELTAACVEFNNASGLMLVGQLPAAA